MKKITLVFVFCIYSCVYLNASVIKVQDKYVNKGDVPDLYSFSVFEDLQLDVLLLDFNKLDVLFKKLGFSKSKGSQMFTSWVSNDLKSVIFYGHHSKGTYIVLYTFDEDYYNKFYSSVSSVYKKELVQCGNTAINGFQVYKSIDDSNVNFGYYSFDMCQDNIYRISRVVSYTEEKHDGKTFTRFKNLSLRDMFMMDNFNKIAQQLYKVNCLSKSYLD